MIIFRQLRFGELCASHPSSSAISKCRHRFSPPLQARRCAALYGHAGWTLAGLRSTAIDVE
ncbi:hypothetical protein K438DRAFT_731995 [Mycena galopus ATCC 62051]|nr:hypothetical protein K438DRAFT_731995 [Mycena galopus ATCC 62051]